MLVQCHAEDIKKVKGDNGWTICSNFAPRLVTATKLENVAITVMYCHLRPPDATAQHFQLNIFWSFKPELQTNPMPFRPESLWGATLVKHRECAMDWDKTR